MAGQRELEGRGKLHDEKGARLASMGERGGEASPAAVIHGSRNRCRCKETTDHQRGRTLGELQGATMEERSAGGELGRWRLCAGTWGASLGACGR
ncbi:hypothetical protein Zm00014a_027203 [Zea mays]|uniref:Uncharacterized protein n=1 Tax=Zea mays TaxID=4577 RepID=A0A3L6D9H3_MAIZE|nr:hypothetical protein Zm00014a_027203 [Zea mays]